MARVLALLLVLLSAWPAQARFLSADPVQASADQHQYFNRHHYAGGNPFKYRDPDGRVLDTVLDVGFAAYSAYTLVREPSWRNAGALGADVAAMFVPGVTGAGAAVRGMGVAADAARLPDDALVVRGGAATGNGANTPEGIRAGTGMHKSGIVGFSTESASGASLCQLCQALPTYGQVGVTSAGAIRKAGGEVTPTSGRSPNHATVSGLSPEVAAGLLDVQHNPAKQRRTP